MRKTCYFLLIACMLLLAACIRTSSMRGDAVVDETDLQPADPLPKFFKAPFVEVILFGYWADEPFTSKWVETRKVPFRQGRFFGWRMKLREPHSRHVRIIERFTLPEPPSTWGPLERRHLVSSDRTVATVPNTLKVREHWIHRANWQISEGDQLGQHVIEIQVNGRMAARVPFLLVEDTGGLPEIEPHEDEIIPDEPDAEPEIMDDVPEDEPEIMDDVPADEPSDTVEPPVDANAIMPAENGNAAAAPSDEQDEEQDEANDEPENE